MLNRPSIPFSHLDVKGLDRQCRQGHIMNESETGSTTKTKFRQKTTDRETARDGANQRHTRKGAGSRCKPAAWMGCLTNAVIRAVNEVSSSSVPLLPRKKWKQRKVPCRHRHRQTDPADDDIRNLLVHTTLGSVTMLCHSCHVSAAVSFSALVHCGRVPL